MDTKETAAKMSELMKTMKEVHAFEMDGDCYRGYSAEAVKAFLRDNPDGKGDFHVYVQDHYPRLVYAMKHEKAMW